MIHCHMWVHVSFPPNVKWSVIGAYTLQKFAQQSYVNLFDSIELLILHEDSPMVPEGCSVSGLVAGPKVPFEKMPRSSRADPLYEWCPILSV